MKKVLVAVAAAALSLGALAFEKYMMRVPDELNPKEGINGVTTYFFAPAAVSTNCRAKTARCRSACRRRLSTSTSSRATATR